jgi:hypothetical protein
VTGRPPARAPAVARTSVGRSTRGDLRAFREPPGEWREVIRTETQLLAERG